MKSTILKVVFAVGALFALANCSKSDDSKSSAYGNCQAGQVYTQQSGGCLNQGSCAYGQGQMPNGQCVQGTVGGYNNGNYANAQVMTQMGPLPVGACAGLQQFNQQCPNYGFYQGNCYPGTPANNGGMNMNQCGMNNGYNNGMNGGW